MKISLSGLLGPAVVGLSLISFTAQAQQGSNFNYSYLDAALLGNIFDEEMVLGEDSYDLMPGLALSGSYQFTDHFYVQLAGAWQEVSEGDSELGATDGMVTLGAALPYGERMDFNLVLAWLSTEAEFCLYAVCGGAEDTGPALGLGVRHWLTPRVEVSANALRSKFDDIDNSTGLNLNVAGWLNDNSSVFAKLAFGEENNILALGYRFTFN